MRKRIFSIIASVVCLAMLATVTMGCNDDAPSDGTDTDEVKNTGSEIVSDSDSQSGAESESDTETDIGTDTETDVTEPISLKINGVDISEYSIIYATSFTRTQCYEDYGAFANELAARIKEMTGAELEVYPDSRDASSYEILLGVVKRSQCIQYSMGDKALKNDDCCIKYDGGKIMLGANCLAGVADAADIFLEHVKTQAQADKDGAVNITKSFDISTTKHVTRIICVGDSITQGLRATDEAKYSYPTKLQAELGYEYDVMNFGYSGATMCSSALSNYAERSYIATSGYYDDVIANASAADIVIIMLGTNDAGGTSAITNLLSNYFNLFAQDYKLNLTKMVKDLRAENKDIKMVLFDAPECYRAASEANYVKYLRPYQKQVAAELGIEFYSIFEYTDANMTAEDFPDQLHPNDTGYSKLGIGAAKALKEVFGIE